MSAEKKARIEKKSIDPRDPTLYHPGGIYTVFGNGDFSHHVMSYICVIDTLILARAGRLFKYQVDEYWKDPKGLIKNFTDFFIRDTKMTREFIEQIRTSGGFFSGLTLAWLMAPLPLLPRINIGYPWCRDVVLPKWKLLKTGFGREINEESLNGPIQRSLVWDEPMDLFSDFMWDVPATRGRVMISNRINDNMMQHLSEKNFAVPRHVEASVVTTNGFSYLGVVGSPLTFIKQQSSVAWEQCAFDGKRLWINDVEAFITRQSPYQIRSYKNLAIDMMDQITTEPLATRSAWENVGFKVLYGLKDSKPVESNGLMKVAERRY